MRPIDFFKSLASTFSSILLLAGALVIIQTVIIKRPIQDWIKFLTGIVLSGIGLHLFLMGAGLSLIPLGESVGKGFSNINKQWVILLIAFVIGYFATLVEPALQTVGLQVEEVSVGTIPSKILIQVVAIGFGLGMMIAIFRILKNIPYLYIAGPLLVLSFILMIFVPDQFRAIAWDAASATTGPINIPINMAIALGLATIIEGLDPLTAGFGVVGLTSLGTVNSVLVLGLLAR